MSFNINVSFLNLLKKVRIMEDIKQSVGLMMDFLSTSDEFDEDLEKELVN